MDKVRFLILPCALLCAFIVSNAHGQLPPPAPTPTLVPEEAGNPTKAESIPAPLNAPFRNSEPMPNATYLGEHVSQHPSALFTRAPVVAGCDPCNCCNPCPGNPCDCGHKWMVRASAIALTRSEPNNPSLVSILDGPTLVSGSQLDFPYEAGLEIDLRRRIGVSSEIEFRYFGVNNLTAEHRLNFPPATIGIIPTSPLTGITGGLNGAPLLLRYESELQSGEINFWQNGSAGWKWSAGFRMLEVNENLSYNLPNARVNWDVDNRLYGFQLGTEGRIWQFNNLAIEGVLKAGIYANRADQTAQTHQPLDTLLVVSQAKDTTTAFVGEAGISAVYRLTSNLSVRAGYQLLWLDGVSLASDQVGATGNMNAAGGTILTTPARMDSSTVLYHGGLLGLEYSW